MKVASYLFQVPRAFIVSAFYWGSLIAGLSLMKVLEYHRLRELLIKGNGKNIKL